MQHLAFHSLKAQGAGYVWKFDDKLMGGVDWGQITDGELLAAASSNAPVGLWSARTGQPIALLPVPSGKELP